MRFLLGVLVLSQIGAACATNKKFQVNDLGEKIQAIQNSVEKLNAGLDFDFAMKNALMEKLHEIGATADLAPYREIYRLFNEIKASQRKMEQSSEVVRFYIQSFEMAKEDQRGEEVTAKDFAYNTFVQVREDLPGWMEKVNDEMKVYSQLSDQFELAVEKAQIGQVNVDQLKKEVDEAADEVRRQARLALKNIKMVKLRMGRKEIDRQPDVRERLAQLEKILSNISKVSFRAQDEVHALERQVGENRVFIIAPHMASHKQLLKVQESMSHLQDLVTQYNEVIQEAWNSRRQARK